MDLIIESLLSYNKRCLFCSIILLGVEFCVILNIDFAYVMSNIHLLLFGRNFGSYISYFVWCVLVVNIFVYISCRGLSIWVWSLTNLQKL